MTLNRVGKAYASKRSAQAYAQRESSLLASVYAAREEVGEGPLRDILVDAARVIRTGTAVIPARG